LSDLNIIKLDENFTLLSNLVFGMKFLLTPTVYESTYSYMLSIKKFIIISIHADLIHFFGNSLFWNEMTQFLVVIMLTFRENFIQDHLFYSNNIYVL